MFSAPFAGLLSGWGDGASGCSVESFPVIRVEPYKKTCSYEVRMESFRVHRGMFSWEMVEICGGKKGIAVFAGGQTRSLV